MADDASPLEPRVAVLEQIARNIETRLGDLHADFRELRRDMRSDFRWLLSFYLAGTAALLGVMAHGFHWI